MKDAIMPIHARPRDVSGVPHARKCFTALVIGAQNSGKSSFIRSFIEAPYQEQHDQTQLNSIKAIREKDPKKKDQYTVKFLSLREVSEPQVTALDLKLLARADLIILLLEANDTEQIEFVKETHSSLSALQQLQLVPFMLI
jgi:GTPase SAR1 family protein